MRKNRQRIVFTKGFRFLVLNKFEVTLVVKYKSTWKISFGKTQQTNTSSTYQISQGNFPQETKSSPFSSLLY